MFSIRVDAKYYNEEFINLPEEEFFNCPNLDYDPPNPSKAFPMFYRGWFIWKWTGWKGNWFIRNPKSFVKRFCGLNHGANSGDGCGRLIEHGDIVYICQNDDRLYHAGHDPYKYNGRLFGQWLAMSEDPEIVKSEFKYAYSSAPGSCGLYNKGDCFDISGDLEVTYYTEPETLMQLRAEAFERLKGVIDGNP